MSAVHERLSRRSLLGAAAGLGLLGVAGCSTDAGDGAAGGETRTVEHALGSSAIPVAPQRVVSLDSNGALQVSLELGAPLIASETLQGTVPVPGYLPAPRPGFEQLGFNQLNLERLAALRPDLIVGNVGRVKDNYEQLSRIAPTVAYRNSGQDARWQDGVRFVGDVLGSRAEIDRRLAGFADRAGRLASTHAEPIRRYSVALLRFTSDELRIVRGEIFGASMLAQVGIRRPASTAQPAPNSTYVSLTEETVGALADSDVLLHFVGGGGSDQKAREVFVRYTGGGIWRGLPAVRAGRVVELDPVAWWDGYSASAADTCLTELDAALQRL